MKKKPSAQMPSTPSLSDDLKFVSEANGLPGFSVPAKTKVVFHQRADQREWSFYLLASGAIEWSLGGKIVTVHAPAAFGHIQMLHEGDTVVFPPYDKNQPSATATEDSFCFPVKHEDFGLMCENPERYAMLCNSLRRLACAGGWDPYLQLYMSAGPKVGGHRVFGDLRHPYEGGRALRALEMKGYPSRPKSDEPKDWYPLIQQNDPAGRLHLICNGLVHPRFHMGNPDTYTVITGSYAPMLVGEFERPLPALAAKDPALAAAIAYGATIAVRPNPLSKRYDTQVFSVEMPYGEYLQCCKEDSLIESMMTALARIRMQEWLGILGTRETGRLRLAHLILKERERATKNYEQVRIPKALFVAYYGRDRHGGLNTFKEMKDEGLFAFHERKENTGAFYALTDINVAGLEAILAGSGRRSRATPRVTPAQKKPRNV